jgi:hypothetical protein
VLAVDLVIGYFLEVDNFTFEGAKSSGCSSNESCYLVQVVPILRKLIFAVRQVVWSERISASHHREKMAKSLLGRDPPHSHTFHTHLLQREE